MIISGLEQLKGLIDRPAQAPTKVFHRTAGARFFKSVLDHGLDLDRKLLLNNKQLDSNLINQPEQKYHGFIRLPSARLPVFVADDNTGFSPLSSCSYYVVLRLGYRKTTMSSAEVELDLFFPIRNP